MLVIWYEVDERQYKATMRPSPSATSESDLPLAMLSLRAAATISAIRSLRGRSDSTGARAEKVR